MTWLPSFYVETTYLSLLPQNLDDHHISFMGVEDSIIFPRHNHIHFLN